MTEKCRVEVAYALPKRQVIQAVEVAVGSTVIEAVQQSGLLERFPDIDLAANKLGVFGKVVSDPAKQQLKDGDRVEIYRPLIADPKAVRKERAAKAKARKAAQAASD